jgi:3-hydroxyacyl-CoA dehydrogenase/enoyl-CoA hydratase/3-hydroxybutyryl-CoA epimerase
MINYEVDGDGIATITWDMPGRSMNVLSQESIAAFSDAIDKAIGDENVKGVIVASGKDAFIAGADLEMILDMTQGPKDAHALMSGVQRIQGLMRRMEESDKPFAAAINGTALGGGYEICLGCNYRVAADNPKAQIGLPEVKVGLLPGGGGTQRLPRVIGIQGALELMLEGKGLEPQKALQKGLIHKVVPAEELLAEAKRWLLEEPNPVQPWDDKKFKIPGGGPNTPQGAQVMIAANAMSHQRAGDNYPAIRAILSCVFEGLIVPIDAGLRIEARYFTSLILDPTACNMVRSLFINKGRADKLIRRPEGIPKTDPKKIGVLGAGMMGAGVAYVSAKAGIEVVLIDRTIEEAETGKAYSEGLLDKAVKRKKSTEEKKAKLLGLIKPSVDYADLEGCDLIVEAVFEDRGIKADVTAKAEAVIPETSVFGSNTSTLPITGLAEASSRPDNFIGIHYFSPVDKMPLVEIIRGEKTSDETLAKALDYVGKIRKTPIVVNDSRGFYTSRVFATYVVEGLAMLKEGLVPALIENVGKASGMPVGPLALADEVSIGLMHHIMSQTRKDLGDAYQEGPSDEVVELFIEKLDRAGKKDGKGFYDYPADAAKHLWPDLSKHYPPAAEAADLDEVKKRFLYIQAIETARCMEENVVTEAEDADVGSIFGWGFAPYTGGVLSLIDTVGVDNFVQECDRMAQKYGPRFSPPQLLRDMAANNETFYQAA